MKKIIPYIVLMLLFLGFCLPRAKAQTGVMYLPDNGFSTYLDTGIELKNDLLDTGNSGEATLEFWIRSSQSDNVWTLTDINADDDHFALSMASENQLSLQLGAQNQIIDLTSVVGSDLWQHIALTISQGGQTLEVYVNGLKRAQFNLDFSANRQLYFYKQADTELYLTEVRGWSKKRTSAEISLNQWRTFVTKSATELTTLQNNEGLEIFYGDDDAQTTSPLTAVEELDRTGWKNIQSGTYDAGCISSYNATVLAQVRNDLEHPILNLEEILMTATKGELSDKVRLQWPHIKDVDGYNIYRDEQLIGNQDAAGIGISDLLTYNDQDVLPSDMYSYRIEGYSDSDPTLYREGTARGFIFPNGEISGNIATESTVYVEGVEVRAEGASASGSALAFDPDDGPVTVNKIELFRNQPDFTLEFWYKGAASPSGTVFQLGGASIAFDGTHINVTNGDGSAYLSTAAPTDAQWHHYAVVLSSGGGVLYQDGNDPNSNATPFSIDLGMEREFSFNASASVSSWQLDEFRMWGVALDGTTIAARYDHILSGSEQDLSLYYRFDLADTGTIYNQADATKGDYTGESDTGLNRLTAASQPPLVYGAYTNASGNYTLGSVNAGTNPSGLAFTVTPSKANHTFNPATKEATLKRSLTTTDYEKTADFTDISSLPVDGDVFYDENDTDYPVPAGQSIELDGQVVVGTNSTTNTSGEFSISAPLGLHEISVNNPMMNLSMGSQSLYFDGTDDYAQSEKMINFQQNGTFSGWIKRGASTVAEQTIMQVGDLKVILNDILP